MATQKTKDYASEIQNLGSQSDGDGNHFKWRKTLFTTDSNFGKRKNGYNSQSKDLFKNKKEFKNYEFIEGFKQKIQNDSYSCGPFSMAIILLLVQDKDPNEHLCEPFNIVRFRNDLLQMIKKICLKGEEKTLFSELKKLVLKPQSKENPRKTCKIKKFIWKLKVNSKKQYWGKK